jgi:aminoglycoside phosphotransferase (APT) family kinase protein
LAEFSKDSCQRIQMPLARIMAALHDIDTCAPPGLSDIGKSGDDFACQFAVKRDDPWLDKFAFCNRGASVRFKV